MLHTVRVTYCLPCVCVCVCLYVCVCICVLAVKSFVELVCYLFSLPDVKVFLSEKICQDPLEKLFGCQRQRGGANDNPTVQQFYSNSQALRTISGICHDVRGNCHGLKRSRVIDWDKESAPCQSTEDPETACRKTVLNIYFFPKN